MIVGIAREFFVTIAWILSLIHYNRSVTINNLYMKKLLSVFILSLLAFSNVAFAGDPDIIFEPVPLEFELIDPGQTGNFVIEPIPFEPLPFDPGDPYTNDPSIDVVLDMEVLEGGRAALTWNRYDGPNFQYYKILHSPDNNSLYYPETPELDFYEDQNKTGFIHHDPVIGDNFYRICVITSDDKRGCSNVIFMFKPANLGAGGIDIEEPQPEPEPFVEPEERPDLNDNQRDRLEDIRDSQNNDVGVFNKLSKWLWNNIGIILAVIAITLAATGFTFAAKRKQKSISKYMNKIDDTYTEYKMKAKRCEAELYRLKDIVDDELKSGKIDDSAYQLLMHRIENYMIDIQKQIVNEKFGGLPSSLKDEMFKMMEDGEITESEMEAMQKLIKRSELSANEQDSLLAQMRDFKKQDEAMKRKGKS